MRKHCPPNERVKYGYCQYLSESAGLSPQTIDASTKAIARYEEFTRNADFCTVCIEQIVAFKAHLSQQLSVKTGERLSKATLHSTYREVRRFFLWLSSQPKYERHIRAFVCDYLRLSRNETRIALARRPAPFPSLEQVDSAIAAMPTALATERRDRAVVALTLLTGARVGALCSLRLKHIDITNNVIYQDARDVHTKFRKTQTTDFFPVGGQARQIIEEWIRALISEFGFSEQDPVFPRSEVALAGRNVWTVVGFEKKPWTTSEPVRGIFRRAFERAGLPYFNPHSIRKTLTHLGLQVCNGNFEALTAWSQNLGHEDIRTTIGSYGEVPTSRQSDIFRDFRNGKLPTRELGTEEDLIGTIEEALRKIKKVQNRKSD